MASDPHWIEHAHLKKGAFTKQADAAGESVGSFAKEHEGDSSRTGQRAKLALVLKGLHGAAPK